MKVVGEAIVRAPLERVWWALNDPAVLVRTIPGCRQLEETGPDTYRMTVSAGVATIKGTYDGEVRISDQHEPSSFVLHASGAGAPGTVSADVLVTLTPSEDGATHLRYDADAVVGGVLGGVGQRMIVGVARKTADEFFRNVEDVLSGRAGAVAPTGRPTEDGSVGPTPLGNRGFYSRAATGGSRGRGEFAVGVGAGAFVALVGVVLGWVLGRRR
jgi:carbon monoxide dehydrogenase subunit G